MVQEVISGDEAFCTIEQMLERYDWNTIAELLTDKSQSGTVTKLTLAEVQASTVLETILREGAGWIEAAVMAGGKYTVEDLEALAGTNSGELLAGLNADLGMWRLYDRRPDRKAEKPQRCDDAKQMLVELAEGAKIFSFQEAADAGRMDTEYPRHSPTVRRASRYFGAAGRRFVDGADDELDNF